MRVNRVVIHEIGPFKDLDLVLPPGTDPKRADVHLLVGANGTGKSTVLRAIAQGFAPTDAGLRARCWTQGSWIVAASSASRIALGPEHGAVVGPPDLRTPIGSDASFGLSLGHVGDTGRDDIAYVARQQRSIAERKPCSATFAYSGLRAVSGARVTAIQEQDDNPLADAVCFDRPEGTRPLLQWIANNRAAEAIYATQGDPARSADRSAAMSRLESAIEAIIGLPVRLQIEFSPFAVQIRLGVAPPIAIDLLPDGVQSILSWLGDLLMRLDRIQWAQPGPGTDQPFLLLLDEIEVHLHPAWQRRVLPAVERLFPNAQIIASTHSPFVIGSATDAWIHVFRLKDGIATVDPPIPSALGMSYPAIVDSVMGIHAEFDVDSETKLAAFRAAWHRRLAGDATADRELENAAAELRGRSEELAVIVNTELRELRRRLASASAVHA